MKEKEIVPKISLMKLDGVRVLSGEEVKAMHKELIEREKNFQIIMNRLILPVRMSIVALLSHQKSTIFNDDLL
jgi:hypothetical protein